MKLYTFYKSMSTLKCKNLNKFKKNFFKVPLWSINFFVWPTKAAKK